MTEKTIESVKEEIKMHGEALSRIYQELLEKATRDKNENVNLQKNICTGEEDLEKEICILKMLAEHVYYS